MADRECLPRLTALGISHADAVALRRISMTLHRWHELECGGGSGCIERDELRKCGSCHAPAVASAIGPCAVCSADNWHAAGEGKPLWHSSLSGRRFPIPDRERGALKRLKAVMQRYPTLSAYVQGDPRGASLYILRPGDVPEGKDADAYYSRGIAVYK